MNNSDNNQSDAIQPEDSGKQTGENNFEKEQRLLEVLLTSAYQPSADRDRVKRLMKTIRENETLCVPQRRIPIKRRLLIWGLACTAVVLLMLLPLLPDPFQSTTVARVKQSLDAAHEQTPRRYDLHIEFQNQQQRSRSLNGDLYVKGGQFMAVRIPALLAPNRDAWAGHNHKEAWVVPAFGPVMVGDQLGLRKWLKAKEEVATPYLHLTTLLTKMIADYDLEELPSETLTTLDRESTSTRLKHIRGARKSTSRDHLPDSLDIWTDPESGSVYRLEARWFETKRLISKRTISLQFRADESIPLNLFDHQTHHSDRRRIVHFDKQLYQQ